MRADLFFSCILLVGIGVIAMVAYVVVRDDAPPMVLHDPEPGFSANVAKPSIIVPPSPYLEGEEALKSFAITDGFKIELVASDPLVQDPVCLSFDGNGRMWVCEMRGFMQDTHGKGEDEPVGRINILEDVDGDGRVDKSTIFLDNLVLPRALCHIEGGLLFADQKSLYYVDKLPGDKPGKVVLIDEDYAREGNVEHKANGLLPALDNWIYSAKSMARYRLHEGHWVKNFTGARGQWGISQDDYGRLVHNSNSNLLNGEVVMPNIPKRPKSYMIENKIYPIRPTTGVNRGYQKKALNEKLQISKPTAACGLSVYRGDNFPAEYYGSVIIPEPAVNLVKLIKLSGNGMSMIASNLHDKREWLASTDERFRPVNSYTAPDGTVYIIDMYRGILQHKTYLTDYLREQILSRQLEKYINKGRIYRVVHISKKPGPQPRMETETGKNLTAHFYHPNGWWRDKAQQLIVGRMEKSVIEDLNAIAGDLAHPLAQIHALWTLEGLGAMNATALESAMKSTDSQVLSMVVRLTKNLPAAEEARGQAILAKLKDHPDERVAFMHKAWPDIQVGFDNNYQQLLAEVKPEWLKGKSLARWEKGKEHYINFCAPCHMENGEGQLSVSPPLVGSEWVLGDPMILTMITINGLSDPIQVAGVLYEPPEIMDNMPGFKDNPDLNCDPEVMADLFTYIRNAWGNNAPVVSKKKVADNLSKMIKQIDPFTVEQISKFLKKDE